MTSQALEAEIGKLKSLVLEAIDRAHIATLRSSQSTKVLALSPIDFELYRSAVVDLAGKDVVARDAPLRWDPGHS